MGTLLSFTILGVFTGAAYAIAASGLVLTYSTTRVFNVAHGAFGMVMAFIFWDFSQRQGMPAWLALALVLLVVAPLFGVLVQRFMTRGLGDSPVSVSLVVTVGLFVGLIGVAQQIWPPSARTVPQFFGQGGLELGSVYVTYHQVLTIFLSGVVALGLFLLLSRTRVGTAMRASVDNPELLKLYGGRPELVSALAWAIGTSLAALAGILLTPGHRPRLLRPHPAGHQRLRRGDARPAEEPAADLRRRDGSRPDAVLRGRLPARAAATSRASGPSYRRSSSSSSSCSCPRRSCASAR